MSPTTAVVWLACLTLLVVATLIVALVTLYAVRDRLDRVDDTADQALALGQSVVAHLSGTEPEGAGRHADGKPAVYRNPHRSREDAVRE